MAEEEYMYTISLKGAKNIPAVARTNWAIRHIREFVARHVPDTETIWIDPELNEKLWSGAREKIPSKIRVKVIHFEDNLVEVSLPKGKDEETEE